MRQFALDRRKLRELIVYISQQCASQPDYGTTNLYKILFFTDFLAYARLGAPITGDNYRREEHGPVGQAVRRVRSDLASVGDIQEEETVLPNVPKRMVRKTPRAKRAADLSMFSKEEMELIELMIDEYKAWKPGKLSKYTHQLPHWHTVPMHFTIPYESVFVAQDQRFTEAEAKHALELARKYGWRLSKDGR